MKPAQYLPGCLDLPVSVAVWWACCSQATVNLQDLVGAYLLSARMPVIKESYWPGQGGYSLAGEKETGRCYRTFL